LSSAPLSQTETAVNAFVNTLFRRTEELFMYTPKFSQKLSQNTKLGTGAERECKHSAYNGDNQPEYHITPNQLLEDLHD
jgi:hypothetical protein